MVIGIDAATQSKKNGLSLGSLVGSELEIQEVIPKPKDVVDVVVDWVNTSTYPVLIAVDSPLGWSARMAPALSGHKAGSPVSSDSASLFNRQTDRAIKLRIGNTPLSVGADKIGRTCLETLGRLELIRKSCGELDLVWDPSNDFEIGIVEVYPAATLRVHDQIYRSYKDDVSKKNQICGWLGEVAKLHIDTKLLVENDDTLDSALCVYAGAEFLLDRAVGPDSVTPEIRIEGWIWACDRTSH